MHTILTGLKRVTGFVGRDGVSTFWPYAIFVFLLAMIAGAFVFVPWFADVFARMQQFAIQHPEQATVTATGSSYSIQIRGSHPNLMGNIGGVIRGLGAVMSVAALFLAAAVTRRLHDVGWTGYLGLVPIPFVAFSLYNMPSLFASFDRGGMSDMRLFLLVLVSNILYLLSVAGLLLLLTRRGSPNVNSFGHPP